MISGWLKYLRSEAADYVMAAWLIAGLAAIIFFLSSNLALCIAVAMAFVGLTLFVYFKLARASSDRSQS